MLHISYIYTHRLHQLLSVKCSTKIFFNVLCLFNVTVLRSVQVKVLITYVCLCCLSSSPKAFSNVLRFSSHVNVLPPAPAKVYIHLAAWFPLCPDFYHSWVVIHYHQPLFIWCSTKAFPKVLYSPTANVLYPPDKGFSIVSPPDISCMDLFTSKVGFCFPGCPSVICLHEEVHCSAASCV